MSMADPPTAHDACPTGLLAQELARAGVRCRLDEPLARHSWYRIGGPADLWTEPGTTEELSALLRAAHRHGVPVHLAGAGANVLFDDAGRRGVVIHIGKLSRFDVEGCEVFAQAGIAVPKLARGTACQGLAGLEHAIGIPGTLGGLVTMNGGSLRRSISESIRRVHVLDPQGRPAQLSRADGRFGYRTSAFQGELAGWTITAVELILLKGRPGEVLARMRSILRERRRRFPRRLPSCGSVFVRDPAILASHGPPGKVIEDTGLKGLAIGDAQVSRLHANFIVNRGGATSADVLAVIDRVRRAVQAQIGHWMACELRYLPPIGPARPAHEVLDAASRPS